MDRNGSILFEEEEIAYRWKEYITELYDDNRAELLQFTITTGNSILREEVQKAIASIKNGKASGTDEISTEMLKL